MWHQTATWKTVGSNHITPIILTSLLLGIGYNILRRYYYVLLLLILCFLYRHARAPRKVLIMRTLWHLWDTVKKHMLSCHHFVNYTSNGVCTTNTIYTLEHDDEYLLFLTAQPQMLQCVPKVPAPRFAKIN